MDDTYDVIILGTGLTECILSGLLSKAEKKVLHMDKNSYYGGESASISPLSDLFKHFGDGEEVCEHVWGRDRDWNVDLVPKFIMAHGELTKLLIKSDVTKYLEFKQIEGSYVYKGGQLYKVPASDKEAIASSLMGIFEKRRFSKFLQWAIGYKFDDRKTWQDIDHQRDDMKCVYKKFGLDQNTQDFTGHAILLYTTDAYLTEKCGNAIKACQLYYNSLSSYGKSPYLYPLYGLGELPQGFARLSAVYGGTYMLDRKGIMKFDETGNICGVEYEGETAPTKAVICDPSYAIDDCEQHGEIIRAICILKHPIKGVNGCQSGQIIFPQNQVQRKSDIYVGFLSHTNQVCPETPKEVGPHKHEKFYIAFVSTTKETCCTTAEEAEVELKPAMDMLGEVTKKYVFLQPLYKPKCHRTQNQVFISDSYDATTHFESVCQNIKQIYQQLTGETIDFDSLHSHIQEP